MKEAKDDSKVIKANKPKPFCVSVISVEEEAHRRSKGENNNCSVAEQTTYKSASYGLLVVVLCTFYTTPSTLFPLHDTTKLTEYWYETMINFNLAFTLPWVFVHAWDANFILKIQSLNSFKSFIPHFLAPATTWCFGNTGAYLLWTLTYGYNWPIPWLNVFGYLAFLVFVVTLWYRIPAALRSEENKRIHFYVLSLLLNAGIDFEYQILTKCFQTLTEETQWILAFLLPFSRLINTRLSKRIIKRVAADKDSMTTVFVSTRINANYAFFIAIAVGSLAFQTTSYLILFIEVAMHLYDCYQIIKLKAIIDTESPHLTALKQEKEKAVQELVSVEILETLVPFIYAISFLIAYYGPNATVLGNIQNSYWQYEEVENIASLIFSVSEMILIDLSGSIVAGLLLWRFSEINLLNECCKMLKAYHLLLIARIGQICAKVIRQRIFI